MASTHQRQCSKSSAKSPAAHRYLSPWVTSLSWKWRKNSLIYAVFNTFFSPLTQERQLRCFNNVARHLTDGGVFLIEAFVPDLARFERGRSVNRRCCGSRPGLLEPFPPRSG